MQLLFYRYNFLFRINIVLLILLPILSLSAQQKSGEKKYKAIDISDFYDCSHHWYDIYDTDKVINAVPNQPRYSTEQITRIADNILLYQKVNGGWPKNYDMLAILSDKQKDSLRNVKGILNTTFDNGSTHSHIEYLATVYTVVKENKYKEACLKGIDFILSAQYPNGGWPQFFPDTVGYAKYITINDGVFAGIMTVLDKIKNEATNYSFVDNARREKAKIAFKKGLECLLICQIKENGILYAWCQKHDNIDLHPQWARAFEPPSICNEESAGVVKLLMNIKNPSKEVINSIQNAVQWFAESKILNTRVKRISAPTVRYKWRTSNFDRVVVNDPKAPPIWTRYYELKTHKPLFCNRDKKPVYSLAEVDRERRSGYGWYTYDPQEILDKYPQWQKKWATDLNVLAK